MNRSTEADVYLQYLGFRPAGAVPTHYELLGLKAYRVTPQQVTEAATRRLQQLETCGADQTFFNQLASAITTACECLIDADRKRTYDRQIQREMFVSPTKSRAPATVGQAEPGQPTSRRPVNVSETVAQYENDTKLDAKSAQHPDSEAGTNRLPTASEPSPQPASVKSSKASPDATTSSSGNHPNYEILSEIGRGASSIVYQAYDRILRRYVAIKELDERYDMDGQESELFWKEARFLASIQHEHIVRIHGVDQSRRWIILELMTADLNGKLQDGPMDPELVRSVLRQILEGLQFLHQRNVLHGEVKLGNILVDENGRVKLSDSPGFTLEGEFRLPTGSLRHVAPELLKPQSFGPVGPGVDLYSLGIAAIEMLVGGNLQKHVKGVAGEGEELNLSWMRWHSSSNEQVPSVRELVANVPDDLAIVIDGLTRKKPDQRYRSAQEAINDLVDKPIVLIDPNVTGRSRSFLDAVAKNSASLGSANESIKGDYGGPESPSHGIQKAVEWTRQHVALTATLGLLPLLLLILTVFSGSNPTPATVKDDLKELRSLVKIITGPPAIARIDEGEAIATPVELELPPGAYQLDLESEGYKSISTQIEVLEKSNTFEFTLLPIQSPPLSTSLVDIVSLPGGASIKVDGVDQGATPRTVQLQFGEHQIEASKAGCVTQRISAFVDQSTRTLEIQLEEELVPRMVNMKSMPEGASVTVDGLLQGVTPLATELIPGKHEVEVVLQGHHLQRKTITVDSETDEFDFELQPLLGTVDASIPNPDSYKNDTEALRKLAVLGELPQQIDILGADMTREQKHRFVAHFKSMLNENWDARDTQRPRTNNNHLISSSQDPRVPYGIGLVMEKQEKLDKALEWYEKARATRPMIANFAPWRRSVIVRLRRQADGDLENALKECVELVDLLDKLARTSETYDDGTDRVIAINIEFVGRVFGFVHSLSTPGTRRFVSSIQSEERTILAMLSGFPTPDNFSALYEAAKNDVEAEFFSRKNMEDEFDRISKLLAESKKERESQGEIEYRKTYGPHETAPNGIDYYEDHGLNGKEKALDNRMYDDSMQRSTSDGRGRSGNAETGNDVPAQLLLDDLVGNSGDGEERIDPRHLLPDVNKSLITRDTKVLMEWIIKHEVWFRKSARASEYVQTYFPMNLELERQKLFKTFPDHLERSQPLFATTTSR